MLRHHLHIRQHRHEVRVAGPARHDVEVNVVDDAGAGDPPEVPAEVVALRAVDLRERGNSVVREAVNIQRLVVRQLAELTYVAVRRDHDVSGRVRVLVDDHRRPAAPVDDEGRLVIFGLDRVAEEAAVLLVGILDVLEPPGRPERLCQIQRFQRKKPTRPPNTTTIAATITQNAPTVPSPGNSTFIPKMLARSVSGRSTALKTVSTRRTSFWRCEIADSLVASSASATSL